MRARRRLFTLLVDFSAVIVLLAATTLLEGTEDIILSPETGVFYISFLVIFGAFYIRFKLYAHVWSRSGIGQLVTIVRSTVATASLLSVIKVAQIIFPVIPFAEESTVIFASALVTLGLGGIRLVSRMRSDDYRRAKHRSSGKRALIVGAGSTGVLVANQLKSHADSNIFPVAFIDDNPTLQGSQVAGLEVLGSRTLIPRAVAELRIEEIIVAMPSVSRSEVAKILSICRETVVPTKIVPGLTDFVSGKLSFKMRDVKIEDLLGRKPYKVDMEELTRHLTNRVVLVTGAGGSIGSELCRQIAKFAPAQLILLGHGENSIYQIHQELRTLRPDLKLTPAIIDIRNLCDLRTLFETHRPDVVFHAAAHKHVPLMEQYPMEALYNNAIGSRNVAQCADEFGASNFVMISTDKAVNPTSFLGLSKRIAELYVQSLQGVSKTQFSAVRFGNVLGSRGSVIPIFQEQIQRGGPVWVTHPDMIRYFMTIPEAVQLVLQAGALARGGEIFVLDMGEPVKIVDLARDLIELSGYKPNEDIQIKFSGTRPGEKLFEELLTFAEGTTSTTNDSIFVAKPTRLDFHYLSDKLNHLEFLIQSGEFERDLPSLSNVLWELVPNYKGTHPIMNNHPRAGVQASH